MSRESIVERIISDAEAQSGEIISNAEKRAEEIVSGAKLEAERKLSGTKAEVAAKVKSILDGRAATARLDSAKAVLKEKRRVLDTVYSLALEKLNSLEKKEALLLAEKLISEFAEDGDELVFAAGYKYVKEVLALPQVKEKNLKHSQDGGISGGFILKGKISDKDVSYGALLAADRQYNQAELATKLFTAG